MTQQRYFFRRTERLKSRTFIGNLFQNKQTIGEYPFRLFWMEVAEPQASPIMMAFSVPKRKFRHAVDRNRIRRRMREAYRLLKAPTLAALQAPNNTRYLACMLLYAAPQELLTWNEWQEKMVKLLGKLLKQLPVLPISTANDETIA